MIASMIPPSPATPVYGGKARPFSFALEPLDPVHWLVRDAAYAEQISEKLRLYDAQPDTVFFAAPGSRDACLELEALLIQGGFIAPTPDSDLHPLWRAARQVQEDLLIMQQSAPGAWHLTAGSLSFPSKWRLAEKAGKRLDAIHGPVPGFGPGARNAALMARMFDKMQPDKPMLRYNWSLDSQALLHRPQGAPLSGPGGEVPTLIRVERQTLTKLPRSGAIVFTIHIQLDPLSLLAERPDLCQAVIDQLAALEPEQAHYKSFKDGLAPILKLLEDLCQASGNSQAS